VSFEIASVRRDEALNKNTIDIIWNEKLTKQKTNKIAFAQKRKKFSRILLGRFK